MGSTWAPRRRRPCGADRGAAAVVLHRLGWHNTHAIGYEHGLTWNLEFRLGHGKVVP